jgi:hypothetical protein
MFHLGMFIFMRSSIWPDEIRRRKSDYNHPKQHYNDYPLKPTQFPVEAGPDPHQRYPLRDPLIQGEAMLKAQAEADRHYGNRAALAKRLADLRNMSARLLEAEQNAICPAKQLSRARAECEAELARIRKTLGQQQPDEQWVGQLVGRINSSSDWDQLRGYNSLVERLTEEQLLSLPDAVKLYNRIHAC